MGIPGNPIGRTLQALRWRDARGRPRVWLLALGGRAASLGGRCGDAKYLFSYCVDRVERYFSFDFEGFFVGVMDFVDFVGGFGFEGFLEGCFEGFVGFGGLVGFFGFFVEGALGIEFTKILK